MDKFFKITERGSNIKMEIMGGLTTFFAMAYIVFVNPNQVAGEGANGWLAAAAVGTLLMAFLANMPFAQACGMGLNSFFCTSFVAASVFGGVDVIYLCTVRGHSWRRVGNHCTGPYGILLDC